MVKVKCLYCSEFFIVTRPWQKFCSKKHQTAWHLEERQRGGARQKELDALHLELSLLKGAYAAAREELVEARQELTLLRGKDYVAPGDPFCLKNIRAIVDGGQAPTP